MVLKLFTGTKFREKFQKIQKLRDLIPLRYVGLVGYALNVLDMLWMCSKQGVELVFRPILQLEMIVKLIIWKTICLNPKKASKNILFKSNEKQVLFFKGPLYETKL